MDWLSGLFSGIYGLFKRAIDALSHLRFSDIWNAIQRGWSRFHRALIWYKKNVLDPWERFRQNLIRLYNYYVGPFILILDTLRGLSRILAVFDRKLAAKLDSFLFGIEAKLYAPLYAILKRVNALSSFSQAIITRLGLFDRPLLIQSLERDWKSVWRVLLNNGHLPTAAQGVDVWKDLTQLNNDWRDFVDAGTGTFAVNNSQLEQDWQSQLEQLG